MSNLDELRTSYEQAEQHLFEMQAAKDTAMQELRDQHVQGLRDAIDVAADAQKALCDAEAAEALRDRPDGEAVAASLGLSLEE